MDKTVCELFAGVGGFRVAFNDVVFENGKTIEKDNFNFVWANQREPATKSQDAYECYKFHFGNGNDVSNTDISKVNKKEIPNHTLLCGGFPCQDYSVARSLSQEKGIKGKKGVLWWDIYEILKVKKPSFVLLENVDRLIKSPSKQRGRDFGIMLKCFDELSYGVEWKVVNAADYGFAQRRRRIFIFAFNKKTNYYKIYKKDNSKKSFDDFSFFNRFLHTENIIEVNKFNFERNKTLVDISENFQFKFENTGYLMNGLIKTYKYTPNVISPTPLRDIIVPNPDKKYFLNKETKTKFSYLRGSKKVERVNKNGIAYCYSEGSMSPYDSLDLPARTMLTSEGTVNRSSHIIKDKNHKNRLRFLTPIECERINGFPDDWTNTGMSEKRRYFMMGNALVVGLVRLMGQEISKIIDNED